MPRFTSERRERLLTLLETGRTMEAAAADVGISSVTVRRWATRGRNGTSEREADFARRLDEVRSGHAGWLTEGDVRRALEQSITRGSITGIKLWFDRYGKTDSPPAETGGILDELEQRRATRR